MVKKKASKKLVKKETKQKVIKKVSKKTSRIDLRSDNEIAMDFATKVFRKFDKVVKSIILFGSTTKGTAGSSSDIDIIMIIDDASIAWDQELIAWYREELSKIMAANLYKKDLHITTVKLTSWWGDLLRGDPTVMNVLRTGEPLIDVGGFFMPLKALLQQGHIRSTPEAIQHALERAPMHYQRSRIAELSSIEGLFWAMVDSAQAALMAANLTPPSPEHIPENLMQAFVNKKLLKRKYVEQYADLYAIHKKIDHGEISSLRGVEIDEWQERTEEFMGVMAKLVKSVFLKKVKRK